MQVADSLNDATLEGRHMCDLEQRIYVIEIYLPQVKYADGVWMEGGEVHDRAWKASAAKVVIAV